MEVKKYYESLMNCLELTDYESIKQSISVIKSAVEKNKWIFTCGNGGSATTASHFVTDWAKMRLVNQNKNFKALCLSDNVGMLSAYANDISYENIFDQSLINYGSEGDVIILVSGSGNSQNVIRACEVAKRLNIKTISLVGFDGGKLAKISDYTVHYPINDMQIAEDLHLSFGHLVMKEICDR
jgi:D-sedoheptulose 7-phosphate isomerase